MPVRIRAAAWALSLAVFFLISCNPKEVSTASVFTLNGGEKDIVVGLGPDEQQVHFTLECDHGWELTPMAAENSWVNVSYERSTTTSWTFSLDVAEHTGNMARAASLLFHSDGKSRKFTVQQEAPAAFFWRRQIGAYGVKGGDALYSPPRQQLSVLHYPGGRSLRILEPESRRVVTLSGLPDKTEAGQELTLHYRVCEKGLVTVSETYTGVRVLRVTPSLAWLRQSDNLYFIVTP